VTARAVRAPTLAPASPAPAAEESDDASVVARILQGDRDAYAVLVRRYQDGLYRFALGMVGNGDAAADLVQDSLVKGFTSLDRCRDPARFGAWLQRILRNRCLDYLKDRRRRNIPLEGRIDVADGRSGAQDTIEREEVLAEVLGALATLPPAQREAFLLKHLEDRPYEEMAETLGASVSALKMRVKRAREALQALLGGERGM
jgi:RNA polymerase sigma-70 factor, ECF subfamily